MNQQMRSVLEQCDKTPVVLVGGNGVTITSVELTTLINRFRQEEGNTTELQHKTLLESIRTEIRALDQAGIGQQNFLPSSYLNQQNKEQPCFNMTKAGALQMLNKESAVVRYKTVCYIEKLEKENRNIGLEKELELISVTSKKLQLPKNERIMCAISVLDKYGSPASEHFKKLIQNRTSCEVGNDEQSAYAYIKAISPVGNICSDYYQLYVEDCIDQKIKPISKARLSKILMSMGYVNTPKHISELKATKRVWELKE